jgi:hypothetical protein
MKEQVKNGFVEGEGRGKAIPVTGRGGPQGYETSRLPHFLDNRLADGGELEKSDDLNGNQTRDLPACSTAPKPTTLPRAPCERFCMDVELGSLTLKAEQRKHLETG